VPSNATLRATESRPWPKISNETLCSALVEQMHRAASHSFSSLSDFGCRRAVEFWSTIIETRVDHGGRSGGQEREQDKAASVSGLLFFDDKHWHG
jgi:hypothetical protein